MEGERECKREQERKNDSHEGEREIDGGGGRDSTRVREIEPDRESERGTIKRERGGQT